MTRPLLAALILTTALAGCGGLNPGRWLNSGGNSPTPEGMGTAKVAEDTRVLIQQVTSVEVDRTPDGAIVRAAGQAPTLGWYSPALVAQPVENGTLTLEFRVNAPKDPQPAGTPVTRTILAATALTNETLAGVNRIVVRGATNALSSR
ncbi:hypothetical protein [Falsirhodobacter sp. 20TX0035]|uniref:hypothetical protein n=1 Tax=Falsirhodobacter sp. 20TX0035 TaxID=3022019 RepID=UPI00232B44ED|nr:hypothetical protein [Falsirhodobacter sp. 20TX0035]MDB6453499.1 hypothetical protein [Falsirhodobacter sp. 20TX0035]